MVDKEQDIGKDIGEEFKQLKDQWKEETAHLSSMTRIVSNTHYQAIIALGYAALPYLFEELQNNPDHWFTALREITGENPVDDECAGNLEKMTEAWLEWARESGYVLEDN